MGCKARVGEGKRGLGLVIILFLSTVKYSHNVCFKWERIQRFFGVDTVNSLYYSKVVGWNLHKTENSSVFSPFRPIQCGRLKLISFFLGGGATCPDFG